MTSESAARSAVGPRVVLHLFKTEHGTARPARRIESSQNGLQLALEARRSHKKSRKGCLRCKTRRVKCDEQHPTCSHCMRKGYICVYKNAEPVSPSRTISPLLREGGTTPTAYPSMISDTFTMEDMRFFHHFIIKAKPHLPVGNDAVWGREIPQFAHRNPFLMHSMLALSATHLGRLINSDCYKVQSLVYRVRGLDGLRMALAKSHWEYGDADSVLGAGYALLQQSVHLEDAMFEWVSLIRTILCLTVAIMQNDSISTEFDIRPAGHIEYISPFFHLLPAIDGELILQGLQELDALRPAINHYLAIEFHKRLRHNLEEHQKSPANGYIAFGGFFGFWIGLSDAEFSSFTDPGNGEIQLLMLHFIASFLLMVPLAVVENHHTLQFSHGRHMLGILGWAERTSRHIPPQLEKYTAFPKYIVSTAAAEISGMTAAKSSVLQLSSALRLALQMNELRRGTDAAILPAAPD